MTQRQFIEKFSLFNPNLEVEFLVNGINLNPNSPVLKIGDLVKSAIELESEGMGINHMYSDFDNCIYTPTKIICFTKR